MKCSTPEAGLCSNSIRILDFDGSILAQTNLLDRYTKLPYSTQVIDLKDIASTCRYLATKKTFTTIRERLENSSRNAITLYGSGDFHHISSVLLSFFNKPLGVIVFDHHPDWDGLSPCVSCGSWIVEISKMTNVEKIILLGPSSDDLSTRGLATAYLKSVKNGKLEIFPYEKDSSQAYFRYFTDTNCFTVKRGIFGSTLCWTSLKQKSVNFIKELLKNMPVDDVYVSIDKDCLSSAYAVTNWEQGSIPIDWLLNALSIIKEEKKIVGMDITGEYSPVMIKNPIKRFLSSLDHPKQTAETITPSKTVSINEATNLKILELFLK
jgi:arginase family enzyme